MVSNLAPTMTVRARSGCESRLNVFLRFTHMAEIVELHPWPTSRKTSPGALNPKP